MTRDLLTRTRDGLFCPQGNFHIDPWRPVDRAVITHAHADHARWGSKHYLAADTGAHVMRIRLGDKANLDFQPLGKTLTLGGVKVTFYPAGHILGSAQVKVEKDGYSVVVSGDYKRQPDTTCRSFEPVRCNTFVTESTFGLPIYRWPDPSLVFNQINDWWKSNQNEGKASLLLAYSLGKAQRLLAGVDASIGPIFTHGAVEKLNAGYRASNIPLPATAIAGNAKNEKIDWSKTLIVAPPAAAGTTWVRKFGRLSVGMASGWMQIRGTRRRRSMDRGFVLSDHGDWLNLMKTIEETQAESVWVTHGYSSIVVRYLQEQGIDAKSIDTEFTGESLEDDDPHSQSTAENEQPKTSPGVPDA
jgi:putative mRNA 3-end processing factor